MLIWIDVEDAAGTRYGDGPILSASGWESTRKLDGAGTFAFSMPAADPRSNLLQHKRRVRCWKSDGDGVQEMGAGIIEQIEVRPGTGDGPTMLRVSGDDLLRELANRSVGDLALWEAVAYSTTHSSAPLTLRIEETYTNTALNNGYDLTLPATVDLSQAEPLSFLYVMYPRAFSKIIISLSNVLNTTVTDTFQVQYYNAENPEKPSWEPLPGLVNNSAAPGPDLASNLVRPFGVEGKTTIEFDPPAGWRPQGLAGWYIVRMFDQGAELTPFQVVACEVEIAEPVGDGLQRIMALAPEGWSLDPAGAYATAVPVYMQFAGESVLSALVMLAEQVGEHFTLSAAARRVWWIGRSQHASGLRAIGATEPGDDTMAITALSRTSDSYELYTRLYAAGGGTGSGRLSMEKATNSREGFKIGTDGAFVEAVDAVTLYGRIDHREDYPEIAPLDVSEPQMIHAANALYERVYHELRRRSQLQYAYALTVAPSVYPIWPGQTVQVDYHEFVDGYHAVNISAELWVLEATTRITPDGLRTVGLTVATVDYAPGNDYQAVARLMGSVQTERSTSLPASGYNSAGSGVPTGISVNNGQVTAVRRTRVVDAGWYDLRNYRVRVVDGLITYLEPW